MKSKHRFANKLFAAAFAATAFSAVATSSSYADDIWKGPGWYQVFDDGEGIVMLWSGPYPSEAACNDYITQKFADKAYMQRMTAKYGDPQVWSFGCPHLDQDLPD